MIENKFISNYFLFLFSLIPISILAGSTVSLINIAIIDFSFILVVFYLKEFSFLKNKNIQLLFLLYIYLIFNSFIAQDFNESFLRNFGFIRLIIFFLALNFFLNDKIFCKKILLFWSFVISIVVIDVIIERNFGTNILGFKSINNRVVSFFKDEAIVGGYLNAFFLIVIGFLMNEFKKKRNFIIFLSLVILLSVFLTGERSNSIKAFMGIMLFYIFFQDFKLSNRIKGVFLCFILVITLIFSSDYLKFRFVKQIKEYNSNNNIYFKLSNSGYEIFKDNKFFGVGNKNFRIAACKNHYEEKNKENPEEHYCTTHPHQVLIEIIAEHGLVGSLIIFYVFFKLFISKIKIVISNKNYVQLGCLIYMLLLFLPIIPTGSFFTDYMITLFFINLSLFYAVDKNLNVFDHN